MDKPKIEIDINRCDFCGACISVCSFHAIIMKENIIFINQQKCSQCYWCFDVCPIGAIVRDGKVNNIK